MVNVNDNVQQYMQLRATLTAEAAAIRDRLNEITVVLGGGTATLAHRSPAQAIEQRPATDAPKKRHFSAASRKRMAAAQKARWARATGAGASGASKPIVKRKPTISAAGKARIAAAARARWARARAAGRNAL